MGDERREYTRHTVHGGNAEFETVIGRGRVPGGRARVIDWSRGGLSLKVKSPRRKWIFAKQDPVLFEDDSVNCKLRLPPKYSDIFVSADVVHVRRDDEDPDTIVVGLRFDVENTPPEKLAVLANMLEPRARTVSGRLQRQSATSQRISDQLEGKTSGRTKRASGRSKRVSSRSKRISKRLSPSE